MLQTPQEEPWLWQGMFVCVCAGKSHGVLLSLLGRVVSLRFKISPPTLGVLPVSCETVLLCFYRSPVEFVFARPFREKGVTYCGGCPFSTNTSRIFHCHFKQNLPRTKLSGTIQAPKHGVFRGGRAEQDRVSCALLSWSVRTVGCEAEFVHPSSGHYPGMKQLLGRPLMVLNRPGFVLFRGRVYALSSTNQKKVTLL